jgi:hypothetical protein
VHPQKSAFGLRWPDVSSKTTALENRSIHPTASPMDERQQDARRHFRYPLVLDVEYRLLRNGRVIHRGFGKTCNISSGGVLFDTDEVPPAVGNVEVLMAWPFFLNGNCQLRLVMRGKIARVAGNSIAVRATSYDFRTGTVQCARTAP